MTKGDIGVSVGNLVLNLRREVGDTRTLANPSIRVRSKEKSKVMIGDKVPVITTTSGSTGFVSDNVSYLDVGLQLEAEPTVFADDDVSIKLGLEVSSVTGQVTSANGTLAYQIGTRNANTVLRLHDGETQLLAGLINHDESSSATRVPGLGDLPVVGRLFSSQLDNGTHKELVLAVTPHIVRNVRRPDASEELWVGTESAPRLRVVGNSPAATASAVAPEAASAALPAPAGPVATVPAQPALKLTGPANARVGDVVTVMVDLDSQVGLRGMPAQVSYDKDALSLLVVQEGGFFSRDGEKTSFTQTVEAADGIARAGVLRNAASLAQGRGTVYALLFKTLKPGPARVGVTSATAISLGAEAVVKLPAPLTIAVQ
jgi:general secretion pathway protein D